MITKERRMEKCIDLLDRATSLTINGKMLHILRFNSKCVLLKTESGHTFNKSTYDIAMDKTVKYHTLLEII